MLKSSLVAFFVAGIVLAQEPGQPRIEMRLLEILHQNKVITDAQHDELRRLAEDMRKDEERHMAVQADLAGEVEKLTAQIGTRAPIARYKVGRGFTWRTPDEDFELTVGGRIQVRFTYDFWDENKDTNDEFEPDFSVVRARLWFRGRAFCEELRYKVQFDVAGDHAETEVEFLNIVDEFDSSNRLAELKDAYVEWVPCEAAGIRAGQFRVPYSRQALTGAGSLQFVDRAITDRVFAAGRDVGVMFHGRAFGKEGELLEYAAGIFDGEGENRFNDDEGLLWAGRLALNPFDAMDYEEGDLEKKRTFRLSAGMNAWLHQDDNHAGEGDDWFLGVDLAARYAGWFFLSEIHYAEFNAFGMDDPTAFGWFAQLGYALIEDAFDVGIRAANIDWHDSGDSTRARREYLAVLGWYLKGHDLKLQTDFGWVEDHEGDVSDNLDEWRLRMQFQLTF